MKSQSAALLLILLSCTKLFAQYALLRDAQGFLYHRGPWQQLEEERIELYRPDSLSPEGSDLLYWTKDSILAGQQLCYTLQPRQSRLMRVLADGRTYLYNRHTDSICIYTRAPLGFSWRMQVWDDGARIEAKVQGLLYRSLLSDGDSALRDSVKVISLQYYAPNGQPGSVPMDTLLLSKSYGALRLMDPDDFVPGTHFRYLAGLPGLAYGARPIRAEDIFNIEAGTEMHMYNGEYERVSFQTFDWRKTEYFRIKRVLKNEPDSSGDFIWLSSVQHSMQRVEQGGSHYIDFFLDTLVERIYTRFPEAHCLNRPAGKFCHEMQIPFGISIAQQGWHWKEDSVPQYVRKGLPWADSCYSFIFRDGCWKNRRYYRGAGGPYGSCTGFDGSSWSSDELRYLKNSREEWGTPFKRSDIMLLGRSEPGALPGLSLYPNPARGQLNLSWPAGAGRKAEAVLCDYTGRELQRQLMLGHRLQWNLEGWPAGLYLLKIIEEGQALATLKLVLQ